MKSIKLEVPAKIILTCSNFPVMSEDEIAAAVMATEMAMNDIGTITGAPAGGAKIGIRVHINSPIKEISIVKAFKEVSEAANDHDLDKIEDLAKAIRFMR